MSATWRTEQNITDAEAEARERLEQYAREREERFAEYRKTWERRWAQQRAAAATSSAPRLWRVVK